MSRTNFRLSARNEGYERNRDRNRSPPRRRQANNGSDEDWFYDRFSSASVGNHPLASAMNQRRSQAFTNFGHSRNNNQQTTSGYNSTQPMGFNAFSPQQQQFTPHSITNSSQSFMFATPVSGYSAQFQSPNSSNFLAHQSSSAQNPNIPPFQQIASPIVPNSNPYATISINPHGNRTNTLTTEQQNKVNKLNNYIKSLDNEHMMILKARKSDFPNLPAEINQYGDYNEWRSNFLMQAQSNCNMHLVLDRNFVPTHIEFPLAEQSDPIFDGKFEIYQAAQEVDIALKRNYTAKLNFMALVLVQCLRNNKSAKFLIRKHLIDPVQIFNDLDAMFIERNSMTKGEYITSFFTTERIKGETFAIFVSKLDASRIELYTLFNYIVQDVEFIAVMQKGLDDEMMATFHHMMAEGKPLHELRKAMISIEVTSQRKAKRAALSNAASYQVNFTYDRQHNRWDSPHKQHYRYANQQKERYNTHKYNY